MPFYFDKHRGLATAAITTGVGAGQFLMPLLVRYLLEMEGFLPTCLIYAALVLNTCVAGLLFHPIEWHAEFLDEDIEASEEEGLNYLSNLSVSMRGSLSAMGSLATDMQFQQRRRTSRLNSVSTDLYFTTSSLALSSMVVSNISLRKPDTNDPSKEINDDKQTSFMARFSENIKAIGKNFLSYLEVLKYSRALLIAVGMASVVAGFVNFVMMVPFALQNNGFTLEESAYCVSLASCCNMIFRGTIPWASDFPKFNKRFCFMLGVLLLSIATFGKFKFDFFIFFIQKWRPTRYSETIR